jgi:hypothetical protein
MQRTTRRTGEVPVVLSLAGCGEGAKIAVMSGPARPEDLVTSILQKLDDEIFYAILDVALDIENELIVGSQPVFIPIRRIYVRYEILCPVNSVGTQDRYCELRWKALTFLGKYDFIGSFDYREQGGHRWNGFVEVTVPKLSHFGNLLTQLKIEEDRRNPGQRMEADLTSATARLVQLADSFHRVALRLRKRRTGREPVLINDEYDVQYVFGALLDTRFEDIRPEEWGPTYAGSSSRVDFLLKNESVLVEMKMTRSGLTDRKLGEELIVDIAHYKQRPDCKALVCFVYDPDHRLTNPHGIENDLSKTTDGLSVRVIIRPKS